MSILPSAAASRRISATRWRSASETRSCDGSGCSSSPSMTVSVTGRTRVLNVNSGPEFRYSDLLPTGADDTPYRLVTPGGVSTFEANGRTFLEVDPATIQRLTEEAMHDIA